MINVKAAPFTLRTLASRSREAYNQGCRRELWGRRRTALLLAISSALAVVLDFCMATTVAAQQLNTIPDLTPPEQAMAEGILQLCPPLAGRQGQALEALTAEQQDLRKRCTEMVISGGNPSASTQARSALQQTAPEEAPVQGTTSLQAGNVQLSNVTSRLAALRGGTTGFSLQGLSFNIDGKALPGSMLGSLLRPDQPEELVHPEELRISPRLAGFGHRNPLVGTRLASVVGQGERGVPTSAEKPSPFGRLGAFVNGTLSIGDKDPTSREAGFDFDTLGITAGVDYRFTGNFVLGAAFGFASTDSDIDPSRGGGDLDTKVYNGAIYGTYYLQNFYLDGIASFGWNSFDLARNIVYSIPGLGDNLAPTGQPTIVNQTAKGDTDGWHYSFGLSAGYDFHFGGLTVGPRGGLNYFKLDIDRFRESIDSTAAGFGLALEYEGQIVESLTTGLGGQASYAVSTRLGVLVPQVLVEWVHEFLDDRRPITARYVNDPLLVPIRFTTDVPDRDYVNVGVGLSAVFPRGTSAFFYYQTALGLEDATKHDFVLGVRLAF
jgi:uncharacterized protein YhjY with autotransporter beta-barrel domain